MDRILFSIPVHERPDLVRIQIDNINFFSPGAVICLHVAADAAGGRDAFARHCDLENVVINPLSHDVVEAGGMLHTHVSNFQHILERGIAFDKIVLTSADELLVKPGLSEYLSTYSLGAQTEVFDAAADWDMFRLELLNFAPIKRLLSALELPLLFGGQAEGQFFDTKAFARLSALFTAHFPMGPCGFPTEKIIPATLAARYCIAGTDLALPVTLCSDSTDLVISQDVVFQVRSGQGTLFARRLPKALRSPHIGASVLKGIFSVKCDQGEDSELRQYIRDLAIRSTARFAASAMVANS